MLNPEAIRDQTPGEENKPLARNTLRRAARRTQEVLRPVPVAAVFLLALFGGFPTAHGADAADGAKESVLKNDVLLRALGDELAQSRTLKLNDLPTPYFISYAAEDDHIFQTSASLGGLLGSGFTHLRPATIRVRVGDYKFDNSDAVFSGQLRSASLPLDDDYFALRNTLWLATDKIYKRATEEFTGKKLILRDRQNPEHAPDFTARAPLLSIGEVVSTADLDQKKWTSAVTQLSGRFASHPEVIASSVAARGIYSTTRYVDTEGTTVRLSDEFADLQIRARVLTAEGAPLHDAILLTARKLSQLPDETELARQVDQVATELEALRNAPQADDYSGPVLFDAPAAAGMFAVTLFDALYLARKPVAQAGHEPRQLDSVWENRVGNRVLPAWLTVYDDPSQTTFRGSTLLGHYEFDDQGVPAQKVSFVDHGMLRNYLLSRTPVDDLEGSDGHARLTGLYGTELPIFGNLFIQAEQTETYEALKAKLLETVKADGLKYGIVIRRLDFPSTADFTDLEETLKQLGRLGASRTIPPPIMAYRVYPDGREELVRGLLFKEVSAKDLRNIVAAGDTPYVLNYVNTGSRFGWLDGNSEACMSAVVAPAVLFDSLDMARAEQEASKPPVVPPPAMVAASAPKK